MGLFGRKNQPKVTTSEIDLLCTINFERETISPGEELVGKVIVEMKKERVTRGLILFCVGEARVSFERPKSGCCQKKYKRKLSSSEIYIEYWRYLVGGLDIKDCIIPVGVNTYEFRYAIPPEASSSFSGPYGCVEYRVEVRMKGHGALVKDKTYIKIFKVEAPLNLNEYPDSFKDVSISGKKIKKVCCFHVGLVGFSFKINSSGFVCGDMIHFNGELYNTTTWFAKRIKFRIIQSSIYAAEGEVKWFSTLIYEKAFRGIDPHSPPLVWQDSIGPIPDVVVTNLGACSIIDVNYWLEVRVFYKIPYSVGARHFSGRIPITIGSVHFDEELMVAYHDQMDHLRSKDEKRRGKKGLTYRRSKDEFLGGPPSTSLFINFSEEYNPMRKGFDDA